MRSRWCWTGPRIWRTSPPDVFRYRLRTAMLLGYPIDELAWLVLLILAGGVVTGILAGLFGIGGGGVIVPVLYEVFGVIHVPDALRMQLCIGTSLAIIV